MPPMKHNLPEAITVTLTVDGTDYSGTYGPGNVELPEPVADLLAAQGHLAAPLVDTRTNADLKARALELGAAESDLKSLKRPDLLALVEQLESEAQELPGTPGEHDAQSTPDQNPEA